MSDAMTRGAYETVVPPRFFQAIHRHPEPRLVVFLGGEHLETDFGAERQFRAGEFVFRPPFFGHGGSAGPNGSHYVRLRVSPSCARRTLGAHGWRASAGRVRLTASELLELSYDPSGGDVVLGAARLTNALTPVAASTSSIGQVARRLRNVGERLALNGLAEEAGWPPWDLTRRFQRAFGMSPSRYRRHARLERAMALLTKNDMTVSRVAADCGFADHSHLVRELRAATGLTPSAFRRLNIE